LTQQKQKIYTDESIITTDYKEDINTFVYGITMMKLKCRSVALVI